MSEDNEFENEWGTKKQKYYSMNKRENNSSESDSDFIEEEKEAIRLQKLRAQKIKKAQLLNEEDEISEKEKNLSKKEKIENELNKNISFKIIEIDNKKISENIDTIKNSLEEIQTTEDEIKIFEDNKTLNNKLPKTFEYLKLYQKINLVNSANVLFNIISTLEQKMTGHHPSIKNTAVMNFLLNKNSEKNEQIQNEIEKILLNLEEKDNNEEINEENELEEEEFEGEDNEELGNELEENEISNEEEEIEEIKNKEIKNNNLIMEKIDKIKKPSFLSKKKRRDKDENKEIDKKANENFDINSESDKSIEEDSDDSFVKEQYKSFNKLNKEKEKLDKEKEEKEKEEIEKKNDFAIRKANKEVLKARGIYRKRKKYQGNAKLMNREKFYKKEKERRKLVKEYEGKPDVYMGEATGIRRDLIRSTKIH